ncbi:MAG: hypothetical protein VKL60_19440 [Sphaerospermopsis sp.]|nr:hypothetical protein [Sphaerospermopsis sp.]
MENIQKQFKIKLNPHITIYPVEKQKISFETDSRNVPIIPLGLVFNIGGVDYFGTVDSQGRNLAVIPADLKPYPVEEKMYSEKAVKLMIADFTEKCFDDNYIYKTRSALKNRIDKWFEQNVK